MACKIVMIESYVCCLHVLIFNPFKFYLSLRFLFAIIIGLFFVSIEFHGDHKTVIKLR